MHPHKNRKFFLFALTIFTLFGVGFGVYQIYSNLYSPLQIESGVKSFTDLRDESQLRSIQSVMSLQNQDSDGDGLSDYDEIYNYKTSPYLKDTDSDGIDDKTELIEGGDPLCHKDKECAGNTLTPPSLPGDNFIEEIPKYPDLNQGISKDGQLMPNPEDQTQFKAISGEISASELRSLLKQSGFTKEQLDSFSDEDLLKTWSKVLKEGVINP